MLACVWPLVALLPTNSLLSKIDLVTILERIFG